MNCEIARQRLFDRLDNEIDGAPSRSENAAEVVELDEHLKGCAACRQEYRLLSLPRVASLAAVPVSPWFYQKLSARIKAAEEEAARRAASLNVVWKLAYRMVPALACITLVLVSIFAWQQTRLPAVLSHSYDQAFISDDPTQKMLSAEQNDITYESVLTALAGRQQRDRFSRTQ